MKQKRTQFHALKEEHDREKSRHDCVVATVTKDNAGIERECARSQREWLEKERNYHARVAENDVAAARIEAFSPSRGGSRRREAYEAEIAARQEQLAREPRAGRRGGTAPRRRRSEEDEARQIAHFSKLKRLLELKARAHAG